MSMSIAVLLLLLLVQTPPAPRQDDAQIAVFTTADIATKRRILNDIAASRSRASIDDVIDVLRTAGADPSADIRAAAMMAVAGRATASRWAGTTGPRSSPATPGENVPERRPVPDEWRGDQRRLRDALYDLCVLVLRNDQSPGVRHAALLALGNLQRPNAVREPYPEAFIDLLVDVYASDQASSVRAEIVKTLRLVPNESVRIRGLLTRALVDPDSAVHREGLNAITPHVVGGPPKVPFEDARETVEGALRDSRPAIRLAAVRALNVFGGAASSLLPVLERMSVEDPDAGVRESSRLAIEAVRREMRPNRRLQPAAAGAMMSRRG